MGQNNVLRRLPAAWPTPRSDPAIFVQLTLQSSRGENGRLRAATNVKAPQNGGYMELDGVGRESHQARDFSVRFTFGQKFEDLRLP